MKTSLLYLVPQLLAKNNISFDKEELSFQIQSHPSFPSLHAITGVLDHFNIENAAVDVPVNAKTLVQLPNSFIAQITTKSGNELVLVQRKKLDYLIFHAAIKKERITESEFLNIFTGIIVIVEKSEAIEKQQDNLFFRHGHIGVLGIFATVLVLLKAPSLWSLAYLLLSLIGILISIAIKKQEEGINTTIGNVFCSSTNEKKDCDAVLASKGAKVFKGFKLSDFSAIYFIALSIAMFLILTQQEAPYVLYIISVAAVPITVYSIYYQYFKVKKLCFLCLSIVGVLWLQAVFLFLDTEIEHSFDMLFLILFCAVIVFSSWAYLKSKYMELIENKQAKIEHFKFKRNFNLFSNLLNQSKEIDTSILNGAEIIVGNEASNVEIVVVTNPFCGHCKPVHELIKELINKYDDLVKIVIRFNVNATDIESDQIKVTSRLLELFKEKGKQVCLSAMSAIYEDSNVEKWLKKWGNCYEKEMYSTKLNIQKQWCLEHNINFTPEIIVNGKSFPREYSREDLIFFIEDLHENCSDTSILKAI